MITKAGSPGGGQCIAPRLAEVCDSPKRGELGRVIFDSGGLRSRYPPTNDGNNIVVDNTNNSKVPQNMIVSIIDTKLIRYWMQVGQWKQETILHKKEKCTNKIIYSCLEMLLTCSSFSLLHLAVLQPWKIAFQLALKSLGYTSTSVSSAAAEGVGRDSVSTTSGGPLFGQYTCASSIAASQQHLN